MVWSGDRAAVEVVDVDTAGWAKVVAESLVICRNQAEKDDADVEASPADFHVYSILLSHAACEFFLLSSCLKMRIIRFVCYSVVVLKKIFFLF